jgi:hypothetical protein
MKYKLRHQTIYTYVNSVDNYQCVLCLEPLSLPTQFCNKFDLAIALNKVNEAYEIAED